jgi:drug/metabolite transporter (DMT)-like permease
LPPSIGIDGGLEPPRRHPWVPERVVAARSGAWVRAMPWVFVLIWSTGFIVARYGMAHAPPLGFLSLRYALSIGCFAGWIAWSKPAWPRDRVQVWHLAVVGVLIQAGYLGGVWSAVKAGMGAATVALLVGLQPVLTALWQRRRAGAASAAAGVTGRQWIGLALGLTGVVLVLWRKLGAGELTPWNLALALLALLCITGGTLYQKRFVKPCDVRTANFLQLCAALVVTLPLAGFESGSIAFDPPLIGAMAWSVLGLTLGGSSLLYLLIQRGAATEVSSLMYLVPPCTALLAWALFDEAFTAVMWLGLAATAAGVALVTAPSRRATMR